MKPRKSIAAWRTIVAVTFLACIESTGETRTTSDGGAGRYDAPGDAGWAGAGGAPAGGVVWNAGAGPTGLERCSSGAPSEIDAGALPAQSARLGFEHYDEMALEGRVTGIVADRMEIETPEGVSTFFWRGPSLEAAFNIDEAVRVVTAFGGYGFSPPRRSIVRSERATAAVVDGSPYVGLRMDPGSTATLQGLESVFPELVYGVVSCCVAAGASSEICDYSALEAHFDGSSTAIALGATNVVGPWSVTNVKSTYFRGLESVWSIQVTLLGPATPRRLDGGI